MPQDQQTENHDNDNKLPLPREWQEFISGVAVNAWALRRKTAQATPSAGWGSVQTHIDAIHDALRQIGVEITGYTGQPYQPGLGAEILTFQPNPEMQQDTITATIRPAVYFHGQIIKRAQVVVSTPERNDQECPEQL